MTMNDTVDESRQLTELERADHAARMERARSNQQRPRTLHALCEQAAVLVPCGQCWAPRGTACSQGAAGPGYHVERFARARRRGLLTVTELAAVLDEAGVFTNATIVRDAGPGTSRLMHLRMDLGRPGARLGMDQ